LVDAMSYRELIGNLLYWTIYKLDIAFVVNLIAQFMYKMYFENLNAINKILRYISKITDLTLKYSKLPLFVLSGYLDFYYGRDSDDSKSTSSYVFRIGLGTISWDSNKHPIVALSTIEKTYRAMSVVT